MKRICILFSLIFIAPSGFAQTNIYHPFPSNNAVWNEIYYYDGAGGCLPAFCKYNYFMLGDTIINSVTYHKIFYNDSTTVYYKAGIREDNKKIYARANSGTYDVKIYDFNLNIGDSIKSYCWLVDSTWYYMIYVTGIDSVLLPDMTYRKRINLTGPRWIEGVGGKNGLFERFNCILCDCWSELVCLEQNSNIVYLNETNAPCFEIPLINNEMTSIPDQFSIFPNPATDNLTIETTDKATIEILNIEGQIINSIKSVGKETTIELSSLASGIYLIKTITDKGVAVKKFIKE
jgi:hypothetical protein